MTAPPCGICTTVATAAAVVRMFATPQRDDSAGWATRAGCVPRCGMRDDGGDEYQRRVRYALRRGINMTRMPGVHAYILSWLAWRKSAAA